MRETDKLYLSRHEVRQLAQCLTTLSRIWGDLECAMVKQTHFVDESKVKSTNSTPLPFNVAAAEHIRRETRGEGVAGCRRNIILTANNWIR